MHLSHESLSVDESSSRSTDSVVRENADDSEPLCRPTQGTGAAFSFSIEAVRAVDANATRRRFPVRRVARGVGRNDMTERRSRGRPRTYDYEQRRELAELIRDHGARGAQARVDHPMALETLLKIAREFRIELKPGRRPRRAA